MRKKIIVSLLIVFVLILCGCIGSSGYDDLEASVESDSIDLKITNENDYAWDNIFVELNGKYEFFFMSLCPGNTRVISLFDFSDKTGMSFLPDFQAVESVVIRANRPDGEIGTCSWAATD